MNNVYMGLDVEDFIFGEGTSYEESYNVTDEEMNKFGVIECAEDPDVACYRIALENEQNHYAIMTAMMNQEYATLESTGSEIVYEGTRLNNFLDAVKAQVQKFWAKVKGVFKKVMDKIASIVLSNKAFVKKYRGVTGDLKMPKDKGFTGYDPAKANLEINYSAGAALVKTVGKNGSISGATSTERNSENLNNLRGKLLGGSPAFIKAEDFAMELKKHLYGSINTENVQIKTTNFSALLDTLELAEDAKKAAKAAHKEAEKAVKEYLSEINKAKSEAEKDDDVKKYKNIASFITQSLTVMSTALSAQTSAIVTFAVQNRKMANYWIAANNKKKGTQESTSMVESLDVVII